MSTAAIATARTRTSATAAAMTRACRREALTAVPSAPLSLPVIDTTVPASLSGGVIDGMFWFDGQNADQSALRHNSTNEYAPKTLPTEAPA